MAATRYTATEFAGIQQQQPLRWLRHGQTNFNQNVTINLTHVFTPTLVNSFKVHLQPLEPFTAPGYQSCGSDALHRASGSSPCRYNAGGFPGYTNLTPGNGIPFGGPQNLYQVYDDLSWSKGRISSSSAETTSRPATTVPSVPTRTRLNLR